jgi:CHAT domain-containing protein
MIHTDANQADAKKCVVDVYDWELDVALAEMHDEFGLTVSAELRYAAAVDRATRASIDRPLRAAIVQRLAFVKQNRGDLAGAMALLDDAFALVESGSDENYVQVRAGVLATRGRVARELGDLRMAEREAERAAATYAQAGDISEGARVLVDLAVVLKDTDRITPARTVARLALALARSTGADDVAGHAMTTLGLLYELLDKWRPALRCQSIALRLLAGCGQYGPAAVAAHNAATVELNRGRHATAEQFYEIARGLNRRAGWPVGEANDLRGLASVAKAIGDHDRARELHAEALQVLVTCGDTHGAVYSLVDLAELADDITALAYLAQAEALATQANEMRLIELVHVALGDVYRRQGRLADAEAAYERAAQAAEAPRTWLFDEADALAYFGNGRLAAREQLARLALDHHDSSIAFDRVESARAREMVRRLSRLRVPATDRVPDDLVAKESVALHDMRKAAAAFSGTSVADPETAQRYASAVARWEAAIDAIAEHDEQYAQLRRGDGSTVARIRATLQAHDPDALLVVLHGTETAIHLLGLTAADETPWHDKVDCDTDALIGIIERVIEACRTQDRETVADGLAHPLLTAMLEPVIRRSHPGQRICLVPHGALHRLPFGAVDVDGRPFGERNPLTTAPSASVLRYCLASRRATTDGGVIVVNGSGAGRPLLYARAQARDIARHLPTTELSGSDASRAVVLTRLASGRSAPRVLHFHAHGRFNTARPMSSGIRLADGDLTAQDLLSVSLPGALVVVCACNTGVSGAVGGDEQLGLIRALLYAGAGAVLVGLWKVNQLAAGILLNSFYRELAQGTASAVALQKAQKELRTCTAATAAEYAHAAREQGSNDPLVVEEARIRAHAGQFSMAVNLCELALHNTGLAEAQRENIIGLRNRFRLAARTSGAQIPDQNQHVFANPYYWAPFALVGDWR